jgi:hypothetical protein
MEQCKKNLSGVTPDNYSVMGAPFDRTLYYRVKCHLRVIKLCDDFLRGMIPTVAVTILAINRLETASHFVSDMPIGEILI